jgi:hypothetical protein
LVVAPLHSAITKTQSHTLAKLRYWVNNESDRKASMEAFCSWGLRVPRIFAAVRHRKGPSRQDNLIEYKQDMKNQVRLDTLPRWCSTYLVPLCKPIISFSNGLNVKVSWH